MSKSDDIKRNSHRIWLAGLGAWASIQENGQTYFDTLADKGQTFENESSSARSASDSRIDELKNKANQTMERIERSFDLRVSSALSRLGITTKSDLDMLNDRVERLSDLVEQLTRELGSR